MEPAGNPSGGPANPPASDLMTQLVQAMATLADISAKQLASSLSKAKAIQRPSPFKGEHGSDARRFLAAFTMWASV